MSQRDGELGVNARVEVLLQPYDAADEDSILHRLVQEFVSGRWTEFRGAVHFAKQSGNFVELLEAMDQFLFAGGKVHLTFGADVFGRSGFATDYSAIEQMLAEFEEYPDFTLHLYHEKSRTFHPKVYLFSRGSEAAMLIIGSSNWSEGGFFNNVEANAVIHLDLRDDQQRATFDRVVDCFNQNWSEPS